jgi:hypothetical protein
MSTVATKPQHATFARSKDDVLSALSFYFVRKLQRLKPRPGFSAMGV